MKIFDLSKQSDRNIYAESTEEREKRLTKEFFKKHGQTDKDVFVTNDFKGDKCAKTEMAINCGYIWFDIEKRWIDKNTNFPTKKEKIFFDNLRKNRGI